MTEGRSVVIQHDDDSFPPENNLGYLLVEKITVDYVDQKRPTLTSGKQEESPYTNEQSYEMLP